MANLATATLLLSPSPASTDRRAAAVFSVSGFYAKFVYS